MSVIPDKIGSLLFCPNCGSLLDVPGDEDFIKCAPCGAVQNAKVYDNLSIVTRSHPSAFPSALRQKRQLVNTAASIGNDNKPKEATIKEKCPGCGNDEMNFHTLQLRSADEGTTVFYDCPKCGYKFSQNN
ncbi:RNA polymerase I subunit A12.2 [Moesziomyces antarcticus]|uniref:DNA-directed RNA polymerase subunit n=4 Tax=Moesziomyces TaxID=63261 RepID=A0A081CJE3_PSEA2|nr:RNA polymerase I subunit A12.2 [Moesziomyces antarcticus]GAC77347.1 RNA polymerase I transcription factor TFIIS, subunit A12.2/RPA12 [Moesziomyces antarcticus T-34]GAK66789.1 RNA polymerase I subunit A12.2 [Moesziomyces antarcticus]SPO47838.1 probable RPA12 - 13.7 kD subunit of DNA-directed RNA polymerase I [Moesziomyces antarcticus]